MSEQRWSDEDQADEAADELEVVAHQRFFGVVIILGAIAAGFALVTGSVPNVAETLRVVGALLLGIGLLATFAARRRSV